jgi:hypothetical protein
MVIACRNDCSIMPPSTSGATRIVSFRNTRPMTPNARARESSKMLPLTAKMPIAEIETTIGSSNPIGM